MGSNERKHKKFVRQLIYLGISALIFTAILFYGRTLEQRSTYFFATFRNPNNTVSSEFKLEIADTPQERSKGLMFRKELPSNGGMIFVYPKEEVQSFWMKNTYVPLDMIFIDKSWNVVGLIPDVPVMTTESRKVDKPSIYVIELLGGTAAKEGIVVGSKVDFNIPPPQAKK